jgi:hypothetical protein
MTLFAAVRGTREREFFGTKAKSIGCAGFDHHERLQGFDGGARIDRQIDVAQDAHAPPFGIYDRDGTNMAALDKAAAHDFDQGWITHI